MKNKSTRTIVLTNPSEADIRAYAYHLYQQGGCVPGHDLGNWLEATACLRANIPSHRSGLRLHDHFRGQEGAGQATRRGKSTAL
jgi:hypothetical protein